MNKLQQLILERCMIDDAKWTGEMKYTSTHDDNFEANFYLKTLHCEQLNHSVHSWSRATSPDIQGLRVNTHIAIGLNNQTCITGLNSIDLIISNTLDDFDDLDTIQEQYEFFVIYTHDSNQKTVLHRDSYGLSDELATHDWNEVANTFNSLKPQLKIYDNRMMKFGLSIYLECCGAKNYVS